MGREEIIFQDRAEAGARLAEALQQYQGTDVVVYALPRGGVLLGTVVARRLHAPFDLLLARKVGHPGNPEYALCAVSEGGGLVCNEEECARIPPEWLEEAIARERNEAARRRVRYLEGVTRPPVEGRTAIIIDDGIATGLTMRAAIREVRVSAPRAVVVAVPIIPRETAQILRQETDDLVAVDIPDFFMGAVGAYYRDFHPVTDEEVLQCLHEISTNATNP